MNGSKEKHTEEPRKQAALLLVGYPLKYSLGRLVYGVFFGRDNNTPITVANVTFLRLHFCRHPLSFNCLFYLASFLEST